MKEEFETAQLPRLTVKRIAQSSPTKKGRAGSQNNDRYHGQSRLNPATQEIVLGAIECGVTLNGQASRARNRPAIDQALVLASRSELSRGEWDCLKNAPFRISAMGSVAYRLARVAAGLADAPGPWFPNTNGM
jgi:hypothetical protein